MSGRSRTRESATLEIVATVSTSGSYTNNAEVTDSSTYDPDSVPGSGAGDGEDDFDTETLTPTPTPGVDVAADVIVSGPSKTNATSKGFTVALKNVGTQNVTVNNGNLDTKVNGDGGATSCKAFSSTLKPGRSVRVHCSANLSSLSLSPGDLVSYGGEVDVPGDGFTTNDTTENRSLVSGE